MFVAGLPATGKSTVVGRAVQLASDLGRAAHLLRWDVARLAFDTPEILARYPELAGVTHAAIRVAAGKWARGAVRAWHERNPGTEHVLIGETPLVGERFASLARRVEDGVEALLASDATLFLVPVPAPDVRAEIEASRARDMSGPDAGRDRASAPPHLVRSHWDDLVRVARALGLTDRSPASYDPDLYADTYRHLLRRRHVSVMPLEEIVPGRAPAVSVVEGVDLVPTEDQVAAAIADVERAGARDPERLAEEWYL